MFTSAILLMITHTVTQNPDSDLISHFKNTALISKIYEGVFSNTHISANIEDLKTIANGDKQAITYPDTPIDQPKDSLPAVMNASINNESKIPEKLTSFLNPQILEGVSG